MPVVSSTSVTHSLQAVQVHEGGALTIMVRTEIDGLPPYSRSFDIGHEAAQPYWASVGDPAASRWDDLCKALYELLVTQGCIAGEIE